MTGIFVNKKYWKALPEQDLDAYVEQVFNYYRTTGFPYFPTDTTVRNREFNKLMNYNEPIVVDDVVRQTMHGLSLAWSYFPHSWSVPCNDMLTPIDLFNDDELLRKVIRKRLQMGDNMSDNGIRKTLKMYSGAQSVSNFRPTAASGLYKHFTNPNDTVLDMSSGFGGRLLGAIKAKVNYVGYEPSTKTYEGLVDLANDYAGSIDVQLHHQGSEEIDLEKESIDFAFTSPPYFDTEKYSNEDSQSYIKYPTKKEWMEDFLGHTFQNVWQCLKQDKYMLINIANTKRYKTVEEDVMVLAQKVGFSCRGSIKLALSNSNFKNKTSAFKFEPIFIFQKTC